MSVVVMYVTVSPARVGCDGDDCSEYYRLVVSLGLMVPLFMALLALFLLNRDRICSLLHGSSGLGR
ncbi:hypothetical protein E2C01_076687 [Portunus trituberculatus]|uniref:Uncharacterized protein n=1 Tax=Portunus trituberculatus TaxID=210409 RepID=A0A5B7II98_PORTR|nr:hypothetical protein [Portunus trituberculatus]